MDTKLLAPEKKVANGQQERLFERGSRKKPISRTGVEGRAITAKKMKYRQS